MQKIAENSSIYFPNDPISPTTARVNDLSEFSYNCGKLHEYENSPPENISNHCANRTKKRRLKVTGSRFTNQSSKCEAQSLHKTDITKLGGCQTYKRAKHTHTFKTQYCGLWEIR